MGQYDKVASPYGGSATHTNPGMIALIKTYCAIKGITLKQFGTFQGSFNTGVEASAGTHDKADCIDGYDNIDSKIMKMIGAFGWHRTRAQGFIPHFHFGRMYSTAMAWLATAQDHAYRAHKSDGLGNLTHIDSSWCPRYRGVKHLSGPSSNHYYAVVTTPGYSQPGCTPVGDKDLIKQKRSKKYQLSNIAGEVECNGKVYLLTTTPTFYLKSDFIKVWAGFTWRTANYTVVKAPAYGRTGPGLDKAKSPGHVRDKGYLVRSIGYCERDGQRFVCTASGTYYAVSSLKEIA